MACMQGSLGVVADETPLGSHNHVLFITNLFEFLPIKFDSPARSNPILAIYLRSRVQQGWNNILIEL